MPGRAWSLSPRETRTIAPVHLADASRPKVKLALLSKRERRTEMGLLQRLTQEERAGLISPEQGEKLLSAATALGGGKLLRRLGADSDQVPKDKPLKKVKKPAKPKPQPVDDPVDADDQDDEEEEDEDDLDDDDDKDDDDDDATSQARAAAAAMGFDSLLAATFPHAPRRSAPAPVKQSSAGRTPARAMSAGEKHFAERTPWWDLSSVVEALKHR